MRAAQERRKKAECDEAALAAYIKSKALKTWQQAVPLPGTVAERYLRKRGIDIELPTSLRFVADPPGLVAGVQHPEGQIVAVQATYLTGDGAKAPVSVQSRQAPDKPEALSCAGDRL